MEILSQGQRSLDYAAILALIGTVIAGLLSASFLPDLIFNPSVYIQIFNNGTRTPELLITNDGSRPANNVHVWILATPPNRIVNITNTFSTASVEVVTFEEVPLLKDKPLAVNSDTAEILIPTLIQGPGSLAYIRTSFDSDNGIKVYTSYNEGSGVGSTQPSIIRSITSAFATPTTPSSSLFLVIIIELVLPVPVAILAFKLARRRVREDIKETLLRNIQENRRKILKDNSTSEEFVNLYRKESDSNLKEEELETEWNRRHSVLSRFVKNPKDYAIIDDLNDRISDRNIKMKSKPPPPEYDKRELNTECFNLLERALNIEWSNFR